MTSRNRDSYATLEENVTFSVQNDATSMNYSGEDLTLEEINDAIAETHIGGAIFVGILMLIGFVGNLHVILIYSIRKKQSNHRVFILCLGILDIVTCSIGMPFILVDLRYPLMFYATAACKILRFLNYFLCACSALVLLVIATERYRKICIPHGKQMTETVAKISCGIAMAVGLGISWPAPVLYGYSIQNTNVRNITGVRCWTENRFKDTYYHVYFNLVLMFIVCGSFTVLCVLYAMIGAQILRHKTVRSAIHYSNAPTISTTSSSKESSADVENPPDSTDNTQEGSERDAVACVNPNRVMNNGFGDLPWESIDINFRIGSEKKNNLIKSDNTIGRKVKMNLRKKERKSRRITFIMFMITLFFLCSFIPHLILQIVDFMKKDFLASLSPAGLYLYNTFIWSFFINNMVNPIIYGFCDKTFRHELLSFYGRLPCSNIRN
ncbi:hypothetical protein CHS0354_035570 [Potamilus streckersoni]|uniref:G-protein coupled receptors family 1 profile domain-containing protein n=1 Tax=Potamilus streckersoni TaxID=2493646 RepID=A0AAE0VHX9_9BIVA|nr:hypothetical protein CHS0354_035570 [Potamilus streckersoni]